MKRVTLVSLVTVLLAVCGYAQQTLNVPPGGISMPNVPALSPDAGVFSCASYSINSCQWVDYSGTVHAFAAGGGNVNNSGTPLIHQTAVWVDATHVKGIANGTTGQVWTANTGADPGWAASGGTPGGTNGQVQYNNSGAFGGFTASGDFTINTSTGVGTNTGLNGTSLAGLSTGILKNTTGTGVPSIAASSDVTSLFTGCSGTQYLGADGACHTAGGGGYATYSLLMTVSQGLGGNALNGSCPVISAVNYCPAVGQVTGTATTPQSAYATFPLSTLGATPFASGTFVEQQFLLPPTITGTWSLEFAGEFDVATSGTVNLAFQYGCIASGSASPTLAAVQTFSMTATNPAGQIELISGTPTISGCSATNMMFTRIGVVSGGSLSANNLRLHTARLFVQ